MALIYCNIFPDFQEKFPIFYFVPTIVATDNLEKTQNLIRNFWPDHEATSHEPHLALLLYLRVLEGEGREAAFL